MHLLARHIPALWSLTLNSKLWGFTNNAVRAVRAEGNCLRTHKHNQQSDNRVSVALSQFMSSPCCVTLAVRVPFKLLSTGDSESLTDHRVSSVGSNWRYTFFSSPWFGRSNSPELRSSSPLNTPRDDLWRLQTATSSRLRARSFTGRRQKLALQLLLKMTLSKKVILIQYLCNIGMIIVLDVSLSFWTTSANHVNVELHSTVLPFAFLYVLLAQKTPG